MLYVSKNKNKRKIFLPPCPNDLQDYVQIIANHKLWSDTKFEQDQENDVLDHQPIMRGGAMTQKVEFYPILKCSGLTNQCFVHINNEVVAEYSSELALLNPIAAREQDIGQYGGDALIR